MKDLLKDWMGWSVEKGMELLQKLGKLKRNKLCFA